MKMQKQFIGANWKMNSPPDGWDASHSPYHTQKDIDIVVFPMTVDIPACIAASIVTGGQYGRAELEGSFTGDVSMHELVAAGCRYVLCGHSDRRKHHNEGDEEIALQVQAAVKAGLLPILCIGETADEREMGQAQDVVKRQLQAFGESGCIIAYEPVWAIGTGKSATPDDAQKMHTFIRSLLPSGLRASTRILYGGSVNPENAASLIVQPDIDGFLVGGCSLQPKEFGIIVDICTKQSA